MEVLKHKSKEPINPSANRFHCKTTYPEYQARCKYKRESDIYSFGVVLFEVLSGSLAYEHVYTRDDSRGLGAVARKRYNEGTLKELIDPNIIRDDDGVFTLNRGPNQASFDAFSKIASKCLTVTQSRRPRMEVIIKELQNALTLQGETTVLFKFRLKDIEHATMLFNETYLIGSDKNGKVYEAEFSHSYIDNRSSLLTVGEKNEKRSIKRIIAAVHRTSKIGWQERQGFLADLQMRSKYKHPNIACLIGICVEDDEIIFVYEHASNKSLDKYLKRAMHNLTWTHRLHICLEIARGLEYLHIKMDDHVDINSANVLLDKNCRAKIVISKFHPTNQEAISMKVYQDPTYEETTRLLEKKSDIYSFGVVLFEIFCGRLAYDPLYMAENDKGLAPIACQCFKDGTIERMIDQKLREERAPASQESLHTFLKVAYQCLGEAAKRPTMDLVIQKLQKALNFQMIGVVEDI
ncbi:hypothetical protein QVD17_42137 [Tagetes erecta]|uniref:Protein kinase domain-containing protein n=1 Tax=Tagetes erecta TaxID=13708 RepID=A0AAD8JRR8_TARER|nr:hypothetical protein QVD17_42137 [Tagetes erecta]